MKGHLLITRRHCLMLVGLIALLFGSRDAIGQTGTPDLIKQANSSPSFYRGTAGLLYDQTDNGSGLGVSSQHFEEGFATYDDQVADDFVVPDSVSWTIDSVAIIGVYFNGTGPAPSFHIIFYHDSSGFPSDVVRADSFLVAAHDEAGSFVAVLSAPLALPPGKYWMSVQARMDYGVGGQWGWNSRLAANNDTAVWRNPGGGFGACPSWSRLPNCVGTAPDLLFALYGQASLKNILVLFQDTTYGSAAQKFLKYADNDAIRNYMLQAGLAFDSIYSDTNQLTVPSYRDYKTVIYCETSFISVSYLRQAQRDSLKAFLNSGTAEEPKSLIAFGGDFGYNYDRTGSTVLDTALSRGMMRFVYRFDNGTTTSRKMFGISLAAGLKDSLQAGVGNFYPDAVQPLAGSTILYGWDGRGSTDSVSGVANLAATYHTAVVFADPRYIIAAGGDPSGGFNRIMDSVLYLVTAPPPVVVSVHNGHGPSGFMLEQNYPNPFNPTTRIQYSLTTPTKVTLKVYNILGQEIKTLIRNQFQSSGSYKVVWDGRNDAGREVSSGVYLYRIQAGDFVKTRKMMLLK